MTREEAIKVLLQHSEHWKRLLTENICSKEEGSQTVKAFNMAIEALEQEPCEDAISREDMEECKELMTDINGDTVYAVRMSDIRQLSSVKPQEPKTGHWIMDRQFERRTCDNCNTKYRWSFYPHNYCPNCGAEMKEGDA